MKKIYCVFTGLLLTVLSLSALELTAKPRAELVTFDYDNTDLSDILTQLAAKKNLNLQFPTQADAIKTKLTYTHPKKLNLKDAWNLALNFLEVAGYSLVPATTKIPTGTKPQPLSFEIVKNKKFISKNLKLYVDTEHTKLPNNDTPIRYLYYFKNITLAADPEAQRELASILSNILPSTGSEKASAEAGGYGAGYAAPASAGDPGIQFDPLTNSLLLSNRANCIRQALEIVQRLDDAGFKETVVMIALQHTDANRIEKMVEELLKDQADDGAGYGYRPPTAKKISSPKYLQNVKAIAVERTNSLILLGDAAAVLKLKNLIVSDLDQPVSSGKSIIHIKRLQYLDAKVFAQTLQNIVRGRRQQAAAPGTPANQDTMKDVIIMAEDPGPLLKQEPDAKQDAKAVANFQEAASSGNNLIIAAHAHDWRELERIIDELDQPQMQISLEVIIADLALTNQEILGTQSRGLNRDNLAPELSWQSAQLAPNAPQVLNYVGANADTKITQDSKIDMTKALDADLLSGKTGVPPAAVPLLSIVKTGATVLSFNDGNGVAYLLNLLNLSNCTKILSQPFLVTQNHKNAIVENANKKLVPGGGQSQSGSWILKSDNFTAYLRINIVPSISNDGKNINLNIKLKVDNFVSELTNLSAGQFPEINIREINTNANLTSGDVLVLGGLTRNDVVTTATEVPILSKIPIIGNLFRSRNQSQVKSTLLVFIAPKIIQPLRQGGLEQFSQHKLDYVAKETIENGRVFDSIKDPVTRFIFPKIGNTNLKTVNGFIEQSQALNPPQR